MTLLGRKSHTALFAGFLLAIFSAASWQATPGFTTHSPALAGQGIVARDASTSDAAGREKPARPSELSIRETYGDFPLQFEANVGQAPQGVKFVSRGSGYTLSLSPAEAVLTLGGGLGSRGASVRMILAGANSALELSGVGRLPGVSNYFIGSDPARWRTNVPNFYGVLYRDVYHGIDLVYYGSRRQLEYDFRLAPGADPRVILLRFEGARGLRLSGQGDLIISTEEGEMRQLKPTLYQEAGGERQEVAGRYVLKGRGGVGFEVGPYDKTRPLVIDPVFEYATFLGGAGDDRGLGVAVDSEGHAYVCGLTTSANFPVRDAAYATMGGTSDAFVAKLSADGKSVLWATYYGGSGNEQARGIAVDAQGNAYITGVTDSGVNGVNDPGNIPRSNPLQPAKGSSTFTDAFVAKLSSGGTDLLYSTYLGGWRPDTGDAIAVDSQGSAYVVGNTGSYVHPDTNLRPFPVSPGAFQTNFVGSNSAAFVTKLTPAGNALAYSTFLGGLGRHPGSTFGDTAPDDAALGVAVDAAGRATVFGSTQSDRFPILNAAQPAPGGGVADAFVTKLNEAGTSLIYSTYLGGANDEAHTVGGVAVDSGGSAYVTADTFSSDFPMRNALQPVYSGSNFSDGFLTKLDGSGGLVFSTFVNDNAFRRGRAVAVDAAGYIYVTGVNALKKFNPAGSALLYSKPLGGEGIGVTTDTAGGVYVAGLTTTTAATRCAPNNFCPTDGAPQQDPGGGPRDAFVLKFKTDNRAPQADAGDNHTAPVMGTMAQAALDGRGSADPDGDPLTYVWRDSAGNVVGSAAQVSSSPLPLGPHVFTLTATDPYGASDSDDVTVTVIDLTPPVLTLPADITVVATGANGASVTYTVAATDNIDGPITPACSPASGTTFATGTRVVECTATDLSGNTATGSFEVTVLSARDASKNGYIDFERYPGKDGVYGTGDEGEACAQHGDDLLTPPSPSPTPVPQRYSGMGVTFTLVGGGTPVVVAKNSPFIAGSPHALKPMTKTDFTSRPTDQSLLKDFDINFDHDVKRVKISALDADEPWELIAYNEQQSIVARVKYDGGSNTAVRSLEVRGTYIRRVRVNIRQGDEPCCEGGPEFFDLLEYEPADPAVLTNTRFIDFETTPGADGVQGTGDDEDTSLTQSISDQYAQVGVTFRLADGSAPVIREAGFAFSDSPRTLYPVSDPAGSQTQIQNLEVTFTRPVSRVKFYAIDADEAWRVRVFSRAGALIYDNSYGERSSNNPFAVEFRVDPCSSPENLIGKVLIIPTKSSECCHSGPEFYDLLEFDLVDLTALFWPSRKRAKKGRLPSES